MSTETAEKKLPISLGADPECNYMVNRNYVGAEGLLNVLFHDCPGSYRGFICPGGGIGRDAGDIGEFRPNFAWNVPELVNNMKLMLTEVQKRGRIISASTKNDRSAVGGHIHFGIDDVGSNLQAIHRKLVTWCLPIILGEEPQNVKKRISASGYGRITGDSGFRTDIKGNTRTYEVRFLTAEWLTTPKIMAATFAYMVTVLNEIKNHPENIKKDEDMLMKQDESALALQTLALQEQKLITEGMMKRISRRIKTFELYPQFKKEITFILNPEKVRRDKQRVNFDIMEGWGLLKEKLPNKKTINNKTVIKRRLKGINIDNLKNLLNFTYNDDTNVAQFVDELTNRVLAFNWKLKHNYMFFGLQNGFDFPIVGNGVKEILEAKDIKTTCDYRSVNEYMANIHAKFNQKRYFTTTEEARNTVIIGLPYNMRMEKDIASFIDIILEAEKKEMSAIKKEELVNDDEEAAKTVHAEEDLAKIGKIHMLLTNKIASAEIIME